MIYSLTIKVTPFHLRNQLVQDINSPRLVKKLESDTKINIFTSEVGETITTTPIPNTTTVHWIKKLKHFQPEHKIDLFPGQTMEVITTTPTSNVTVYWLDKLKTLRKYFRATIPEKYFSYYNWYHGIHERINEKWNRANFQFRYKIVLDYDELLNESTPFPMPNKPAHRAYVAHNELQRLFTRHLSEFPDEWTWTMPGLYWKHFETVTVPNLTSEEFYLTMATKYKY